VTIPVEELKRWEKKSKELQSQIKILETQNQTLRLELEEKKALSSRYTKFSTSNK